MQFVSRRRSKFLDRDYVFEHFFWVSLGPHDYVRVLLDGETCDLMCEAKHLGAMATFRELRRALEPQSIVRTSHSAENNRLSSASSRPRRERKANMTHAGCLWIVRARLTITRSISIATSIQARPNREDVLCSET